jgi:hypothetical protein
MIIIYFDIHFLLGLYEGESVNGSQMKVKHL